LVIFLLSVLAVFAVGIIFILLYLLLTWLSNAANKKWPRFPKWFLPASGFFIVAASLTLLPVSNLQWGQTEVLNVEQTRDIRMGLSIAIFVYALLEVPYFFHHFKQSFSNDFLRKVALNAAAIRDEKVASELIEMKKEAIQEIGECVEDCIISQVYDKEHLKAHGEKRLAKYNYHIIKARTDIDFTEKDPLYKYIADDLESLFAKTYYKKMIYYNEFWKSSLGEILNERIIDLKSNQGSEERINRLSEIVDKQGDYPCIERTSTMTFVYSSLTETDFKYTADRFLHYFKDVNLPLEEYYVLDSLKETFKENETTDAIIPAVALENDTDVHVYFERPTVDITPNDDYSIVINERSILPIDDTFNWRIKEELYLKGKLEVIGVLKDYEENERPHIEIFCPQQKQKLKDAENYGKTGRKREYSGLMLPGDGFVVSWPF